jgi:hypothetical protein
LHHTRESAPHRVDLPPLDDRGSDCRHGRERPQTGLPPRRGWRLPTRSIAA